MGVRFFHKAGTHAERTIFIGLTVALVLGLGLVICIPPLIGDPAFRLSLTFQILIIAIGLGLYGYAFFHYFLPIFRSKKGWEYRVQEGGILISTPIKAAGDDLDVKVEDVLAVIYESRGRDSSGNWWLELAGGRKYKVPIGGGLKIIQLIKAILKANPRIEKRPDSASRGSSGGQRPEWPKEWPSDLT